MTTYPVSPGATNFTLTQLDDNDLVEILGAGPQFAQTTLAILRAYLAGTGPTLFPARLVTTDAAAVFAANDTILGINKTVAGATGITLPTPSLGRVIGVQDVAGNSGTYNITLDAGAGNLINGSQTLVMNGNFGTTLLIGWSATLWGILL